MRFWSEFAHTNDEEPEFEFKYHDDTGAWAMMIYVDDMRKLMGIEANTEDWPFNHIYGYETTELAGSNEMIVLMIAVEVNMRDRMLPAPGAPADVQPKFMRSTWETIACQVVPDLNAVVPGEPEKARLNGPWMRSMLYTATAPERPRRTYVSTHKSGIWKKDVLPIIDIENVEKMVFPRPEMRAGVGIDPATGMRVPFPITTMRGDRPI